MSEVKALKAKLDEAVRSGDVVLAAAIRVELDRLAGRRAGMETR